MKKSQAPTLVDVAREAGVSLKTASRVLNESSNVNEKKVAKVQAVMEQLGYRPNELARGLKARRSAAIGMIVPNLSDPFFSNAVKAVQEGARAKGHVVIVSSSGGYPDLERSEIETMVRRQIDGLVIAPADSRKNNLARIIPVSLPVVTFDEPIRGAKYDSVTVTNRESAREATQHLLDHGARSIVAIGARPHLHNCSERVAGYREAMDRAGLEPRTCLVAHENMLTLELLEPQISGRKRADAIFSLNWVCTLLILHALRALGREVSRGPALLLSFDDLDLADVLTPALSAVAQPSERLGAEAIRMLFERLNGAAETSPRSVVLPTRLMLRESCGCGR
jgi:LacI family transcriptional regulator